MFVQDATAELWAHETVRSVLVPRATDAVLSKPCDLETLVAAARLFVRHLATGSDGGA